jgi:hypothetical protein
MATPIIDDFMNGKSQQEVLYRLEESHARLLEWAQRVLPLVYGDRVQYDALAAAIAAAEEIN